MKVKINEKWKNEEETTLYELKEKYKRDADIVILNGFPINEDKRVKENDRVVFIKRGETYTKEELKELMRARHTPVISEKLEKAKVVICGAGGLGSNVATAL
ncbi:MAG: ThiS-like ubiquitin domain-containing protein, partial [Clostridium sp.]